MRENLYECFIATQNNEEQWLIVNPVRLAQSPSGYIVLIGKENSKPQSFFFPSSSNFAG